jgi:hypothetical protein
MSLGGSMDRTFDLDSHYDVNNPQCSTPVPPVPDNDTTEEVPHQPPTQQYSVLDPSADTSIDRQRMFKMTPKSSMVTHIEQIFPDGVRL